MKRRVALTLPPTSSESLFLRADFNLQYLNNNLLDQKMHKRVPDSNAKSSEYQVRTKNGDDDMTQVEMNVVDFNQTVEGTPTPGKKNASSKKAKASPQKLPLTSLRKSLIKKIANYYIILMETEDLDGNYKIGASSEYFDIVSDELNLLESDINKFDELKVRRSKIMELKNLMYTELKKIKQGYNIDPSIETYEKSNEGYPTLFKNDRLVKKYSLNKVSDFRQNMTAILERICEGTSTENDEE